MRKTPLEDWISRKVSSDLGRVPSAAAITGYQLGKLKKTIDYVLHNSPFYRERLAGLSSEDLRCLGGISGFPFTTRGDLEDHGPRFLCGSQSQVERVVTLPGVEGATKERRLYFTSDDLELTTDFFHHGMRTLVNRGQKVLILMPGERPGSVGDLLLKGLSRAGVSAMVHGVVQDPARTIRVILENKIECLVGIPTQVLALARHKDAEMIPESRIKSVLLSADYVPSALVHELRCVWGCGVFGHYGTTEMGLGGGVECEAFSGYHLREADLLFEIVDPASGRALPEGQRGEIVFTTLTRAAMPLVRYRTGDMSRFLPEPCPCGTVLRRLEKVRGKTRDMVALRTGEWLGITDLDEALFSIPGIVNYAASLTRAPGADRVVIEVYPGAHADEQLDGRISEALVRIPAIMTAINNGQLLLEPIRFTTNDWITTTVAKRTILVRNEPESGNDSSRNTNAISSV